MLDLRSLKINYGLRDLYYVLSRAFSTNLDKFREILTSLSSVKILGNEVAIRWRGRNALTLPTLFDSLNKRRTIIAMDEAQRLKGS